MSTTSKDRTRSRWLSSEVAAVVAVLGLVAGACGTSTDQAEKPGTPTPATPTTPGRAAAAAKQLWVQTEADVATGRPHGATVVRVSPDGRTVVVAGGGPTVAYDAASGTRLWQAAEDGMANGATWLALSPDGSAAYVTGTVAPDSATAAYRTVAYGLAGGKRLWAATFRGSGGAHEAASVIATAKLVVVDGTEAAGTSGSAVVTVAYDARTGAQQWVARVDAAKEGPQGWFPNGTRSLAVDPAGTTAYVTTGGRTGDTSAILTVAYDTATGARRWLERYTPAGGGNALGAAVAVSPDGATVVMTGMAEGKATRSDSVTIGYDATTGKQRWVETYDGPASQNEGTGLLAFRPDGATVFAAGTSEGATVGHEDMIVLAYDTATGDRRWAVRWNGPTGGDDNASDLTVSPDGSSVVVVGRTVPKPMQDQYATVALEPASGAVRWTNTYGITTSAEGNIACNPQSVAVAANGTVFVTGSAASGTATLAYEPPQ